MRALPSSLALLALAALAALPGAARAGDGTVSVLILKEHGVGSAAQAQGDTDRFTSAASAVLGWTGARGTFRATRAEGEAHINASKPAFAVLSLESFVAFRSKHSLEVLGQATPSRAGGQQYHLVSRSAADAAGCKGKPLISDLADDTRFIDGVVFGGKLRLADFSLIRTTDPTLPLKKVAAGEATCALIDDAQLAGLASADKGLRSVWQSRKLPPMVVVAFPSAPAAEKKGFEKSLARLCEGAGKEACVSLGFLELKQASGAAYEAESAAYARQP